MYPFVVVPGDAVHIQPERPIRMSNRRRIRHHTAKMTANSVLLDTRHCEGCGSPLTRDPRTDGPAVHDCATGDWYVVPRRIADAFRVMSDEEAAEWAGMPVAEVQRIRRNAGGCQ